MQRDLKETESVCCWGEQPQRDFKEVWSVCCLGGLLQRPLGDREWLLLEWTTAYQETYIEGRQGVYVVVGVHGWVYIRR